MIPEIKKSSGLAEFLNAIIQERTGTKKYTPKADIAQELCRHLSSYLGIEETYAPILEFLEKSETSDNIGLCNAGILIGKAVKDFYSRNGRDDLVNRLEYDVSQSILGGELVPNEVRELNYLLDKVRVGPVRAYVPSSR